MESKGKRPCSSLGKVHRNQFGQFWVVGGGWVSEFGGQLSAGGVQSARVNYSPNVALKLLPAGTLQGCGLVAYGMAIIMSRNTLFGQCQTPP